MPEMREVFEMVTKQTEPDLDAWKQQERRQRRSSRIRKVSAISIAAAIGIAAVIVVIRSAGDGTGTQPGDGSVVQGPPPTAVDLNGVWLQVEDASRLGLLVRFSPNGTFTIDDGGNLVTDPAVIGTFRVDEDAIIFTSEASDLCTEGDSWAWQASLPGAGRLHVGNIDQATGGCLVPNGTGWTLIRVSPASTALQAITARRPGGGPPPTASELAGIWLPVEPTSPLIRFGPDGTFTIDDGGHLDTDPVIQGTYRVDENTITFTVDGGDACTVGDDWAWRASLPEDGLLVVVYIEAGTGNCGVPGGTEWTLIRLAPSSAASVEASGQIVASETAG